MVRVLHFDRASIQLTRFDVMHMANAAHLKTVLAALAGLSSLFCACAVNAHSAISVYQPVTCNVAARTCVQEPTGAKAAAAQSGLVVAVNSGGVAGLPRRNPA